MNRRDFIKNMGLAGCAVGASGVVVPAGKQTNRFVTEEEFNHSVATDWLEAVNESAFEDWSDSLPYEHRAIALANDGRFYVVRESSVEVFQ